MLRRRSQMVAHNTHWYNSSSSSSSSSSLVFRQHTLISKSQHILPLLLITEPRYYHRFARLYARCVINPSYRDWIFSHCPAGGVAKDSYYYSSLSSYLGAL